MREHRQLEFAVAVHEIRIGEKVQPVCDVVVEGVQQAVLLAVCAALEQFLRFDFSVVAEVVDQQMAHLITVTCLFHHDAHERSQVVFRRRVVHQEPLLFVGGELGVTLIDDHIHQRVAHALIGHLQELLPPRLPFEVAKIYFARRQLAVLRFELITGHVATDQLFIQADIVLPIRQHSQPVIKRRNPRHQSSPSWKWRWHPSSASRKTSRASESMACETGGAVSTSPSSARKSLSSQSSHVSSGSPSISAGKRTQKPSTK